MKQALHAPADLTCPCLALSPFLCEVTQTSGMLIQACRALKFPTETHHSQSPAMSLKTTLQQRLRQGELRPHWGRTARRSVDPPSGLTTLPLLSVTRLTVPQQAYVSCMSPYGINCGPLEGEDGCKMTIQALMHVQQECASAYKASQPASPGPFQSMPSLSYSSSCSLVS